VFKVEIKSKWIEERNIKKSSNGTRYCEYDNRELDTVFVELTDEYNCKWTSKREKSPKRTHQRSSNKNWWKLNPKRWNNFPSWLEKKSIRQNIN